MMKTCFRLLSAGLLLFCSASLRAAERTAFSVEPDTAVLWAFNEGEGMVFADQVRGFDLNATSQGGKELTWTEGKFGKALRFPGEVRLDPSPSSSKNPPIDLPNGEVTVEAWVRTSEEGRDKPMGVLQWMSYCQWGFRMLIDKSGRVTWLVEDGSKEVGVTSKEMLPYGEWCHVAGTYDRAYMRVFINGQMVGERPLEGGIVQPVSNDVMVGYFSSADKPFFIGDLNGIRISNKARTAFPTP